MAILIANNIFAEKKKQVFQCCVSLDAEKHTNSEKSIAHGNKLESLDSHSSLKLDTSKTIPIHINSQRTGDYQFNKKEENSDKLKAEKLALSVQR